MWCSACIHALGADKHNANVFRADERPNILFFFTDDQAFNTLGIYGNEQVKTPNLDRLGERGVVFDRHYNTTAICMASRACVMSGLYEYKTGCNFTHGPMGLEQWATAYPVLLKQAGYKTGFAGKIGFSVSELKNVDLRGEDGEIICDSFDFYKGGKVQTSYFTARNARMVEYAEAYPHSSRSYGAATIDFMRESVKSGQPFCMTVFFKAPHMPFIPDPFFDDVYKDTVWKRPDNFGPEYGEHLPEQARSGRQARYYEGYYKTDSIYQDTQRKYHQLIHGVDYSIGMILQELEKLGIADNTLIIFTSDNGYSQGARGFGGKVLPYEEPSRAPLIIYDPRLPGTGTPRRTDAVTGGIDVTATILDAARVEIPAVYDGKSLLPVVRDQTVEVRESLPLFQVWGAESTRCLSVVTKEYKYIHWYYADKGMTPGDELYHIAGDPMEMTNLAGNPEYAPVLKKMQKLYEEQVEHWKAESVDYNGYGEYGILFDQNIPWKTKAELIKEKEANAPIRTNVGKKKKS
ncbi:sulfatase family protein [Pontiella agarivorans]|uniref:Sulfatase n=1 Tax=Pontiella agarivorans TaxID=3038953 RepID=A0ABU5MSA1_9BACT|nr:sulfatase [Pontiella agarivorans]MDZ8117070.1 sulfatase [Pontiella agarivorans]